MPRTHHGFFHTAVFYLSASFIILFSLLLSPPLFHHQSFSGDDWRLPAASHNLFHVNSSAALSAFRFKYYRPFFSFQSFFNILFSIYDHKFPVYFTTFLSFPRNYIVFFSSAKKNKKNTDFLTYFTIISLNYLLFIYFPLFLYPAVNYINFPQCINH